MSELLCGYDALVHFFLILFFVHILAFTKLCSSTAPIVTTRTTKIITQH
jgi:hypothetical protein